MIHVVKKILQGNGVIQGFVGNKIHLVNARQGTQRPFIVVDLEETQFERNNSGVHGEIYNVQVYITDTHISDCWAIHTQVKNSLSEFEGTIAVEGVDYNIGQISLMDVITDAHELHDFYVIAMSFNVFIDAQ